MKAIAVFVFFGLFASSAYAQDDWIEGGIDQGFITLTNTHTGDANMLGIDITSSSGGLKATGSHPFSITLLDTPNNVVLGNLGNPFTLSSGVTVVTDISFTGLISDLSGFWGNGVVPTPINFVPEPGTFITTALGLWFVAGKARRRRSSGPGTSSASTARETLHVT